MSPAPGPSPGRVDGLARGIEHDRRSRVGPPLDPRIRRDDGNPGALGRRSRGGSSPARRAGGEDRLPSPQSLVRRGGRPRRRVAAPRRPGTPALPLDRRRCRPGPPRGAWIVTPCLGLLLDDPALDLGGGEQEPDPPSLRMVGEVNERAYRQSGVFAPMVGRLRDDRIRTHGLRVGGEFACVALTMAIGDDLSIQYVATDVAHRRRGLATRLLLAMMAAAKAEGLTTATLQATRSASRSTDASASARSRRSGATSARTSTTSRPRKLRARPEAPREALRGSVRSRASRPPSPWRSASRPPRPRPGCPSRASPGRLW